MDQNKISEIPYAISSLQNLTELRMQRNKITYIPDSLSKCKKLEELNLWYNRVSELPNSISKLENIMICLNGNKIKKIPDNLKHMRIYLN